MRRNSTNDIVKAFVTESGKDINTLMLPEHNKALANAITMYMMGLDSDDLSTLLYVADERDVLHFFMTKLAELQAKSR